MLPREHALREQQEEYDKYHGPSHTAFLEDLCENVEKELGLILDSKMHRRRVQQQGFHQLAYHISKHKHGAAFRRLKEQFARWRGAVREKSARLIQRVGRGWLARIRARAKRRNRQLQIQAELDRAHWARANARYAYTVRAVGVIQERRRKIRGRFIRITYAAGQVQRVFRGWSDREYVRPLQAWRRWRVLYYVVVRGMHHLTQARYRLRVVAKIRLVDALVRIEDTQGFAKTSMMRRHAAAFKIGRSFKAYRMRVILDKRIYWHRWVVVVKFQARARGYLARKLFDRLLSRHRARIRILSKASVQLQRMARGYLARARYAHMLEDDERKKAERARLKADTLLLGGGNGAIVRSVLRRVQPLRYAWEVHKCKKIQRVWRGYKARKRCKILKLMYRFAEIKRKQVRQYNGATNIIRIFRGFVVRRYVQDRLYGKRMTQIQSAWRQYSARRERITRRLKNEAMVVMRRYFKSFIARRRWHVAREPINLRRCMASNTIKFGLLRGLWRHKRVKMKNALRTGLERGAEAVANVCRIRNEIQLRILQESLDGPIGKRVVSVCGEDCPAWVSGCGCVCVGGCVCV